MMVSDIGVAVVGAGFIGPVHVEALRRLGLPVRGILGCDRAESQSACRNLGLPRAYDSLDEVLADPQVQSLHLAVPNVLHYEFAKRAIAAGKHVLCEKPLAMTAEQSGELVELAKGKRLAAGVCYNVRFYPLNLEARDRVARGEVGRIFAVNGSYVQDWLFHDTDYNWRVLSDQGGALRAVADIGTHWMDLVTSITGLEIEAVLADLNTVHPVRKRPKGEVETFSGKLAAQRETEPVVIDTEDYGCVLFRFKGGARGSLWVSQVTAGRKNSIRYEIAGSNSALAWNSESPNELWIGRRDKPNEMPDSRSGPGRPVRPRLHQLSGRPQRRLPRRLQAMLPRVLQLHCGGRLRRRALVPHLRRRASRGAAVRGHFAEPPPASVGSTYRGIPCNWVLSVPFCRTSAWKKSSTSRRPRAFSA